MEPQDLVPVTYAATGDPLRSGIGRIIGVFAIIFAATHAAKGGFFIYLQYTDRDVQLFDDRFLTLMVALARIIAALVVCLGGIRVIRGGGRPLLMPGLVVLFLADASEMISQNLPFYRHWRSANSSSSEWWALAWLNILYLMLDALFPAIVLTILRQLRTSRA